METLAHDLRFALRQMRRSPGVTAAIALSLGLAIGANTTIFTLLKAVFLNPVPVAEPNRVVQVFRTFEQAVDTSAGFLAGGLLPTSYPNYEDLRDRSRTVSGLAAYTMGPFNLASGGEPEQVFGGFVNAEYFPTLGIEPAAGRFFLPEEDRTRGSHPVVVLSHGLWQRRFGGSEDVVGSTVTLNGRSFTVVGVAPRGFTGLNTLFSTQLWVPVAMHPDLSQGLVAQAVERRDLRLFGVVGRLAPGVSRQQAEAELQAVAAELTEEHPQVNANRGARVLTLPESALNPNQRDLFVRAGAILAGAVGLVLAIACANAANLLLARARRRQGEMAMRLHLGAGRWRLARQLLTESLLLALLGGMVGWVLAGWGREVLWSLRPPMLAHAGLDLALDGRVMAFCLAATLATGLLFGLAPALAVTRAELARALPGRSGPEGRQRRLFGLRRGLVVVQVALSLVALVTAGLFLQSLANARRVDPGYETDRLLVVSFDTGAQGYSPEETRQLHQELRRRVEALPGVEAAGLATAGPLSFAPQWRMKVDGAEELTGPDGMYISVNTVTPGYFETLGVPRVEGRLFDSQDRGGRPVVVVNRTLAERFWPDRSAVGRLLRWPAQEEPFEVVGVVENLKYTTLGEPPTPYFYRPASQEPLGAATLHVRTKTAPEALLETVRREIRALDPDLPVVDARPVEAVLDEALWAPRLAAQLLGTFGLVALLLAATGLYAVLAYSVQQRRREIGVRVALGARSGQVLGLVIRDGMLQVGAGVLAGALAALAASRLLGALLYDLSGLELSVLLSAAAVLGGVALLACLLPAFKATGVDPAAVLRQE